MSAAKELGTNLEDGVVKRAKAKGLDARKQPGSGVFKGLPNDAVINRDLIECKVRSAELEGAEKSVRVSYEWLNKVRANARKEGFRMGVVVIRAKGQQKLMVLLDFEDYLTLLG